MPGQNYLQDKTWRPNAVVGALRFVKYVAADQDACAPCDTAGELVAGVIQEGVTADDVAKGLLRAVRPMGTTHVVAGAALDPGMPVRTDNQGRAVPLAAATANQNQAGIAWTKTTGVGDRAVIQLTPGVVRTTT